ncbi:uncharacterized protein N7483_008794 [Penicillium malachiteum]|uniref:uncharacterized protein n=1 Tax=Penicillium malachiteum TaxID=1324776 RepID=UPI002549633D|nr:uncharacterized protein N7483_008794 [Penicillium malachiteum]KAJ5720860.1 hypothetical protein N7483_008794 [Penicillium malachiteum]
MPAISAVLYLPDESGHEIPDGHRGGKQKRACDSCASIRKACNGEIPCTECRDRGRVCNYERVHKENSDALAAQIEADSVLFQHNQDATREDETFSSWSMGLQNYYPPSQVSQQVYARRNFEA